VPMLEVPGLGVRPSKGIVSQATTRPRLPLAKASASHGGCVPAVACAEIPAAITGPLGALGFLKHYQPSVALAGVCARLASTATAGCDPMPAERLGDRCGAASQLGRDRRGGSLGHHVLLLEPHRVCELRKDRS
jgi:hypothetical protein